MNKAFWKPVRNKKFRTGRRGWHNATCPYCGEKKKNINLHYRKYHPETIEKLTGEFGELYGVRFIMTSEELERPASAGAGPSGASASDQG